MDISFKSINKLALPALIAGVAEPLLSLTDLSIVGGIEFKPTLCIGAIGIVGTFLSMLIWVFGQTRSAISSIISRYLGQDKFDEIGNLPIQVIYIVIFSSLLIIFISFPFASQIFKLLSAKGLMLEYSLNYFKIRILGLPFTLFTIVGFGVFRGLQNTKYTMFVALIGTAINIILDIILIFGIDGLIPPFHLEGAAYASVIAQGTMALITLYLLITKTNISLKLTLPFHKDISSFMMMVFDLFIRTISLNIAFLMSTKYAASYGDSYIAAYAIGFQLWLTGAFLIDGFSSAGSIMSGKLLGAKDYNTLLKLSKKLMLYGFLFGVFICIVGLLFYNTIAFRFSNDVDVLRIFKDSFWFILVMQPICAITYIFDGFFKGMGKTNVLRNVLLVAAFLVFIPVLLILDTFGYKLYGIWIAFLFFMIARGAPLFVIFFRMIKTFRFN